MKLRGFLIAAHCAYLTPEFGADQHSVNQEAFYNGNDDGPVNAQDTALPKHFKAVGESGDRKAIGADQNKAVDNILES